MARGANFVSGFTMDIERERQVRDAQMTERLTTADALHRYVERNVPHKTAEEQAMARRMISEGERILKEVANARR